MARSGYRKREGSIRNVKTCMNYISTMKRKELKNTLKMNTLVHWAPHEAGTKMKLEINANGICKICLKLKCYFLCTLRFYIKERRELCSLVSIAFALRTQRGAMQMRIQSNILFLLLLFNCLIHSPHSATERRGDTEMKLKQKID